MAASILANRVKMTVSGTPGAGQITLGSAVSTFQTFAQGGVTDGQLVSYIIEDGSGWEVGQGTYVASGTLLSRTTIYASSNSGSAISATSSAIVSIAANAADLQSGTSPGNLVKLDNSALIPAQVLPLPAVSTLGGVKAKTVVANQFLTAIGTDGAPVSAQPSAANISGLAASATTDTTSASNITSGTLPIARIADGSITQAKLAYGVAGNGPIFWAATSADLYVASALTPTKVPLNVELVDSNNCFDTVNQRFLPNVAGYYQINASVYYNPMTVGSGGGYCQAIIMKNGIYRVTTGSLVGGPNVSALSTCSNIVLLNGTTDYVELYANCSTAYTIHADGTTTYLSGFLARSA